MKIFGIEVELKDGYEPLESNCVMPEIDVNQNMCNQEPLGTCPYCGNTECWAEHADNGFGSYAVQIGPYYCDTCGAYQCHPNSEKPLTEEEKKTGWYMPTMCICNIQNRRVKFTLEHDYYFGDRILCSCSNCGGFIGRASLEEIVNESKSRGPENEK